MISLRDHVNCVIREYIIDKVNEPLAWAIIKYGGRYPEPTHENVLHPNSHRLLDLQEEFFKRWKTRGKTKLYKALWRTLIVKYEHSPPYQWKLDWLLMRIPQLGWKPFNYNRQMFDWRGE